MEGRRITVRLDPSILLERLILDRLAAIPKPRHQDWLRSLLVNGYLAEARVLREVQNGTANPSSETACAEKSASLPPSAYASWLRQPAKRVGKSREDPAEKMPISATPH